jgi:hypothetical protein
MFNSSVYRITRVRVFLLYYVYIRQCVEIIYSDGDFFTATWAYELETAVKFEVSWNAFITVAKF